jgi:fatty acid desaturase
LFGLVERHIGTKEECAFLCQIGLKSPEKINVCVTNYAPAVLVGIFVLGLVAILVFGLKGRGGKPSHKVSAGQSSGKSFLKSKTFWKVVAGIVGVVLLILYFKILIWVAIGILVVLIVDAIFLRRKIWKAVKKIFRG